jgi:hypothetical protein
LAKQKPNTTDDDTTELVMSKKPLTPLISKQCLCCEIKFETRAADRI